MNVMTVLPTSALSVPAGPARFTVAEFRRMAEADVFEDVKLELIGGELHRMPPPGTVHGRLQAALIGKLIGLVSPNRVSGEVGIDLGSDTVVGVDAAILATSASASGWLSPAQVELVVEIAVSTRDRDLGFKRHLYAAAGIPTYWVIDAERRVVHVFDRPERDDYLGLSLTRFGEPLAVPGGAGAIVLE